MNKRSSDCTSVQHRCLWAATDRRWSRRLVDFHWPICVGSTSHWGSRVCLRVDEPSLAVSVQSGIGVNSANAAQRDKPCKGKEGLFYTFIRLGRRLHKLHAKFVGKCTSLDFWYGSLVCPIRLITDQYLVDTLWSMLFYVSMPSANT